MVRGALNRRKTSTRDTLASRGSRADPHCHIVTTFEAKESGALSVLVQNLGISGRLEWLSEVLYDAASLRVLREDITDNTINLHAVVAEVIAIEVVTYLMAYDLGIHSTRRDSMGVFMVQQ